LAALSPGWKCRPDLAFASKPQDCFSYSLQRHFAETAREFDLLIRIGEPGWWRDCGRKSANPNERMHLFYWQEW